MEASTHDEAMEDAAAVTPEVVFVRATASTFVAATTTRTRWCAAARVRRYLGTTTSEQDVVAAHGVHDLEALHEPLARRPAIQPAG